MTATGCHYTLRWNNHQNDILSAFDTLLQAETLVDVTLVCAEKSVKAHKVVLSACSPFFQGIFSENPCKHPVIILKDFSDWEVQAVVDFMYKGEISVAEDQLQSLVKAGESLQIRGLGTSTNACQKENNQFNNNQGPAPSSFLNDYENNFYQNTSFPSPIVAMKTPTERSSPISSLVGQHNYGTNQIKSPDMEQLSCPEFLISKEDRNDCQSPIPEGKQITPRRRSGGLCAAQDLITLQKSQSPIEETTRDLFVKKPKEEKEELIQWKTSETTESSSEDPKTSGCPRRGAPRSWTNAQLTEALQNVWNRKMSTMRAARTFGIPYPSLMMYVRGKYGKRLKLEELRKACIAASASNVDPHSALRGGQCRSWTNANLMEALQLVWSKEMSTMRAAQKFGIPYNSLKLYVRGKYGKRLKLEELRKSCTGAPTSNVNLYPALNGGHLRSWTNAELMQALQQVWNRKITIQQASRIFDIPYTTLWKYVGGTCGKGLKMERRQRELQQQFLEERQRTGYFLTKYHTE